MTTTSKGTSTVGSRSPWSGLLDVLLGRVPARNAGFFQRPQDGGRPNDETALRLEPGHVAGGPAGGSEQNEAHQPEVPSAEPHQREATSSQPADAAPGLRVRTERVSLDDQLGLGAVDGVWWPRSSAAPEEVTGLLEAMPDDLGRLIRVALSMDDWSDDQPRVVQADDHPLHLAWFAGMRRHTAHLTFEGGQTALLLVLPPETDESAAGEVLEAVGQDRSRTELLSRAGIELEQGAVDTSAQDDQPAQSGSVGAV